MKRSKNNDVVAPGTAKVLDGLYATMHKAEEAGAPEELLDVLRAARDKVVRVGSRLAWTKAREIQAAQRKAKAAER